MRRYPASAPCSTRVSVRLPKHINLLFLALTLIAGLWFSPVDAQSKGASLPDTLYAWGDTLQFVALDRAVDAAGNIDAGLLKARTAEKLQRKLDAVATDGCVDATVEMSIDAPPEGFEDIAASLHASDHVLIGEVTGLRPGFYSRMGYLIGIETVETLKGHPNTEFYLFFPKGRITFQGKNYCMNHSAYPALPEVGDRMLVMHTTQSHGPLVAVASTQLVVLPVEGAPAVGGSIVVSYPNRKKTTYAFQSSAEATQWAKQVLAGPIP